MAGQAKKLHDNSLPKSVLIFIGKPLYLLLLWSLMLLAKIPNIRFRVIPTLIAILFLLFAIRYFYRLPPASELVNRNLEVSTKIYDRNGVLLYKIYKNKNRTPILLGDIPREMINATLAAEDAEFYSHPGFSVRGITRALINNIKKNKLSGGSTITQQLVKNALLSPEKTLSRKIKEIILAVKVEATYPKDKILEMYLNEVPYGGTAYGIAEASRIFFGKEIKDLNLAEAAFLAGLPQSPSRFSPFGSNPDLAFERQREILRLMVINKYISDEEEAKALNTPLTFAPQRTNILAPHFVMYVKDLLEERYGKEAVESGGLNVKTTLDINIQKMAERAVNREIAKLKSLNVTNAGVLILNPQTGEILAMVGGSNYFDIKSGGNVNITLSLRPPGSSIKVVNYAYALSHGYTPASILQDTPVTFNTKGSEPYTPQNYDGKYRGNLPLRMALAESRNIPAVKVLNSYGVEKMVELGRKMGITTWDNPKRFGLSLTLGGGEVRLIDLAQVYATLANSGKRPEINPFLKITNYKGNILWEGGEIKENQVIDPRVAFLITDVLKDNRARSSTFGLFSQLLIQNHPEVAVKTGTSNNLRDNLTLGYNQDYLVAVWVGNNNNSPMSRVASGVTGASPIWNDIMTGLLKDKPSHEWKVPEGLINLPVCRYTGTLSCNGCSTNLEWFLEESAPKKGCDPEYIKKLREEQVKKEGEILEPAASTQN